MERASAMLRRLTRPMRVSRERARARVAALLGTPSVGFRNTVSWHEDRPGGRIWGHDTDPRGLLATVQAFPVTRPVLVTGLTELLADRTRTVTWMANAEPGYGTI